jgi:Tol biopolymer transport system component
MRLVWRLPDVMLIRLLLSIVTLGFVWLHGTPIIACTLPDAGQLAFINDPGSYADVFLLDLRTHIAVNLTRSPERDEIAPAWSPDGAQLVFQSLDKHALTDVLYIRDMRTGRERRLTHDGTYSFNPDWSPDGTQIVYVLGYNLIRAIALDGSDDHQMARGIDPAWSPDGTQVAYITIDESGGTHLASVHVETGTRQFLSLGALALLTPAWSPDGRHIAATVVNDPRDADIHVFTVALPTCQSAPVLRIDSAVPEIAPAWSPDGTQIAYLCALRPTSSDLCVINIATGERRVLTVVPPKVNYGSPAWRP